MMTLVPWNKTSTESGLSPLGDFHREMDRIFSRFFDTPTTSLAASGIGGDFAPAMDLSETDAQVVVKAELPGVDPAQIEVKVQNGALVLSGKKEETKEEKGETFYRSERVYGSFLRSITLPSGVDPEHVNAEFKNGVLTIKLNKKPESAPKKIKVLAR